MNIDEINGGNIYDYQEIPLDINGGNMLDYQEIKEYRGNQWGEFSGSQ